MRAALEKMVHEGLPRPEAAALAGLTDNGLYRALRNPAVLRWYNDELAAVRNAEKPRNLRVATDIRDDATLEGAAGATAKLKAIAAIEGRDDRPGVTIHNNVGVAVETQTPGYRVVLNPHYVDAEMIRSMSPEQRRALNLDPGAIDEAAEDEEHATP
ncbi:MAG: hypothetical protein KIS96_01170 [Bauldia sp.]|nr:hypothetical protein [Bauldia sp.]